MRVLHAPIQIAGQLWEYADGLRKIGVDAVSLTFSPHPFGYKQDVCLDIQRNGLGLLTGLSKLIANFISSVNHFDIFHFHFGGSLMPRNLDLPILKHLRKIIVMNFWGSDVRLKSVAKLKNPFFLDDIVPGDDESKIKRMRMISRYVNAVIISDHELYEYVSQFFGNVFFVRQAIDTDQIKPTQRERETDKPLIVHAPSDTVVKGTVFVDKVVDKLSDKYDFNYVRVTAKKHAEVLEIVSYADIVIDQLLLGTYGIFSIESMALGKPVICYIRDDLIGKYPSELPIINANPSNLDKVLIELLRDKQLREEVGKKSRLYVEKYHNKIEIAKKLLAIYTSLRES